MVHFNVIGHTKFITENAWNFQKRGQQLYNSFVIFMLPTEAKIDINSNSSVSFK